MTLILQPSLEDIKTWGDLAYVTSDERDRIMSKPVGQRDRAVQNLKRQVDAAVKKKLSGKWGRA